MPRLMLALLLLLAACVPYDAPAPSDPRLSAANAMSTLTYATQVAAIEQERLIEQTRAAGTQQALTVQLTAGAATAAAGIATDQAAATATMIPLRAAELRATIDSLEREQAMADVAATAAANSQLAWSYALPASAVILVIVAAVIVITLMHWRDRRMSVTYTPVGLIVHSQDEAGRRTIGYIPPPAGSPAPRPIERNYELVDLNAYDDLQRIGASTWVSRPGASARPHIDEALRLLRDTMAVQRAMPGRVAADQVASWRLLGDAGYSWTSDTWKAAVGQIRDYLDIQPRSGTRVRDEWGDVARLHFALETTDLLSPTPLD
jgi:hypothetical protein